jgi:hypothetical protein
VTFGGESSARQRLAQDADRARFSYRNCEYVGRSDKFEGACKKNYRSNEFTMFIPRNFSPLKPQTDGYFIIRNYLESLLELLLVLRNKHVINCICAGCLLESVCWGKGVSPTYPFILYINGSPIIQ